MKSNEIKDKVKYTDSKLITVMRWFAWVAASVISASINVWFMFQLASRFWESVIFAFVAVVLECGKISAILRANIFSALHKKADVPRIQKKKKSSYTVYAAYAIFSILCATAFAVNMTTTNISNYDNQIALLEQQRDHIIELQVPLVASDELVHARARYEELQELFLQTNREDDAIQYSYRVRETGADGELLYPWAAANASTLRLRSVRADRDEAQVRWDLLQSQYDLLESERREMLAAAIRESGTVFDIDSKIGQNRINKAMNAGSAQIFLTLGDLFKFDPNSFRLIILMFLAILIEYIVFSMAPTSKVNRKLLYDYREYIPKDMVIKILREFDDELELYLGVKNPDPEADEKLHAAELTIKKLTEKKKPQRKPKVDVEEAPAEIPVPQPKIVEVVQRVKDEPPIVEPSKVIESPVNGETGVLYRFGRANEKITEKFKDFMTVVLPEEPGKFIVDPDDGARMSGVSNRLRDTFLKRLSLLKLEGSPLVYEEDGRWYSSRDRRDVIEYSTEIIEDR